MFESDLNKNTNAYKALAEEFREQAAGKVVLPAVNNKMATKKVLEGMRDSINAHPSAKGLFEKGEAELTLIWDDPATGIRCKARLDFYDEDNRRIVDLKKTSDAGNFMRQIINFNYDLQTAWHLRGARECFLGAEHGFVFVAVEDKAPFRCEVGGLTKRWLHYADAECSRLLGLANECEVMGYYPAYGIPESVTTLSQIEASALTHEWDIPSWR